MDATQAESRSLKWGMFFNVIMGTSGVAVSILANSEALLVDGLYSLVNFGSAMIALRVSKIIQRQPDHHRPFGYDADEALYVLFRSLVLLGVLAFAAFGAASRIIDHFRGEPTEGLILGPIIIYSAAMVVLCFFLAGIHQFNYKRSGKISEILATERTASVIDGFLSGGAGIALVAISLLKDTPVGVISPIADSLVVLVMVILIFRQPLALLRKAMAEVAGEACDPSTISKARSALDTLCETHAATLIDVSATRLGRTHTVIAFICPNGPVEVEKLDQFRDAVRDSLRPLFGRVRSEVLFTNRPITHDESSD